MSSSLEEESVLFSLSVSVVVQLLLDSDDSTSSTCNYLLAIQFDMIVPKCIRSSIVGKNS